MSLFVLDTEGDFELGKKSAKTSKYSSGAILGVEATQRKTCETCLDTEEDDNTDYYGLPPPSADITKIIKTTLQEEYRTKTKADLEMDLAEEVLNKTVANAGKLTRKKASQRIGYVDLSDFNPFTGKFDEEMTLGKVNVDKEMSDAINMTSKEKEPVVPKLSRRQQHKLNQIERSKTKGASWFNLPATEITEEVKNDLKILQMRSVLDPKRFYKKNDLKVLPKYFQIGTVLHSPLDYYSERNVRRNKKKSLVDEIMADVDVKNFTKRKYNEIIERRNKYAYRKALKKMKAAKKK